MWQKVVQVQVVGSNLVGVYVCESRFASYQNDKDG